MMARRLLAFVIVGLLSMIAGGVRAESIVLASTTSVQDSGLLEHILPAFTAANGIEVRVLAQGTGQALATAARGDADLVLVHDPEAEDRFIAAGHGKDRRQIAWNDFVIVGPGGDPAHVGGGHDAQASEQNFQSARYDVLLQVNRSYVDVLHAQSLVRVAEQTVAARQLLFDQVSSLAKNNLRSQLDVSFADVNVSEAKLLLLRAEDSVQEAYAELSRSLGSDQVIDYQLVDEPLPPSPPAKASSSSSPSRKRFSSSSRPPTPPRRS